VSSDREVVESFHRLYYDTAPGTCAKTSWLGVPTEKFPGDLWVYQEIITEIRPDFIVETGTRYGGSAVFMATVCEVLGHGRVVTIDIEQLASTLACRPEHPRIAYLTGSSTSPDIVATVRETVEGAPCVMVVLDSDHRMAHVADELRLYSQLVTDGSYLIVEDTNINGHPVVADLGPGPWEAVEVFLKGALEYRPDYGCEKLRLTLNPRGYLRKNLADSVREIPRAGESESGCEREDTEDLRIAIADQEQPSGREAADEDSLVRELDLLRDQLAEAQYQARQAIIEVRREADETVAEVRRQADETVAEVRRQADGAIAEARRHAAEAAAEAAADIAAVSSSASWRLTAPLRKAKTLLARRTT
jgi:cephalosporin hydroxylase